MIKWQMLGLIDLRLRQAFLDQLNEPFGGQSILMFGNFGQLLPVLNLPIFSNDTSHNINSNNGIVAYKHLL